jgi:hypothetical protein
MRQFLNRTTKMNHRRFSILLLAIISFLQCLNCFAENKTIIFAKSGMPDSYQTWFYSSDLNETNIKKYWDDDYCITSAAYTNNGWFVTMSKTSGLTRQFYNYTKNFPGDWIKQKWNEDYYITSISSSRTHWLVVMSKGVGYTNQSYKQGDFSAIKTWYLKKKTEGYYVTAADYTGTEWWIVMSKGSDITAQYYFIATTYSDLSTKIKEKVWNKGYNIHLIEYGADGYLVFYGKLKNNNRTNRYSIDPSSPKNAIQNMWDKNEDIAYIGGGYEGSQSSTTSTTTSTATPSGHGLPYEGETKYWRIKGYQTYMSLRAYKDNYGEVIYEKYPRDIYTAAFSFEVWKKAYTDNGYYVLQKYKRTLVQTGLSQFGNDKYEKLSGTLKVSFDGNKVIDDKNNVFNQVITKEEANQISQNLRNLVNSMGGTGNSSSPSSSSSSGGSGNNSYSSGCSSCHGTGVNPMPNSGGSMSSWVAYYNSDGNRCPYCGRYDAHYHDRCSSCNVPRR